MTGKYTTLDKELQPALAAREGDRWWFDLQPLINGQYTLWVNARDLAGNVTSVGPFRMTTLRYLSCRWCSTISRRDANGRAFTCRWCSSYLEMASSVLRALQRNARSTSFDFL